MQKILLAMVTLALVSLTASFAARAENPQPSGSITISQTQVALLVSGTLGGGQLNYDGKTYAFSIGGLGVGGIGVSTMEASGSVYDLKSINDFPGVYGQARTGWAAGEGGEGKMWLQNEVGVIIELKAKRDGVMLAMGADGILITMD